MYVTIFPLNFFFGREVIFYREWHVLACGRHTRGNHKDCMNVYQV